MRNWRLEFVASAGNQKWSLAKIIAAETIQTAFIMANEFCDESALQCECIAITEILHAKES